MEKFIGKIAVGVETPIALAFSISLWFQIENEKELRIDFVVQFKVFYHLIANLKEKRKAREKKCSAIH